MAGVNALLRQLLPAGSRGSNDSDPSWENYPDWPPDAFAVAATIVVRSGCYTSLARNDGPLTAFNDPAFRRELVQLGKAWRSGVWYAAPDELDSIIEDKSLFEVSEVGLQDFWATLRDEASPVEALPTATARAALALMIASDEACAGIGFPVRQDAAAPLKAPTWVQSVYASIEFETPENVKTDPASFIEDEPPATATIFVDTDIACVQPKARTPSVGCTLRSLTHHVALLPPQGLVRARWSQAPVAAAKPSVFNLLVVPYPYRISGRSIVRREATAAQGRTWGWFGIKPDWLPFGQNGTSQFIDFVSGLIKEAEKEVAHVDGIVIPELALNRLTRRAC